MGLVSGWVGREGAIKHNKRQQGDRSGETMRLNEYAFFCRAAGDDAKPALFCTRKTCASKASLITYTRVFVQPVGPRRPSRHGGNHTERASYPSPSIVFTLYS